MLVMLCCILAQHNTQVCWITRHTCTVSVGMEAMDSQTSRALLEFSYHLAVGDMQEAHKVGCPSQCVFSSCHTHYCLPECIPTLKCVPTFDMLLIGVTSMFGGRRACLKSLCHAGMIMHVPIVQFPPL